MSGRRLAIVEDEPTIRDAVASAFRREGFDVLEFDDGRSAWEALDASLPDITVLDIGLPRMDGLELCRRLRARSESLPIIFVTSREEEFDRVLGLEIGADDYLCKPFSMRELVARVRVLMRRSSARQGDPTAAEATAVRVGNLRLEATTLRATLNQQPVPLTVTEFLLLQALASRPDHVKSREQLMEAAYPDGTSVSDRTIDSHIKRIRRKLETVDRSFKALEGVYGAGYRYRRDG